MTPEAVALEGLPFSGKSTCLRRSARRGRIVIPEYHELLPQLGASSAGSSLEDQVTALRTYRKLEADRWRLVDESDAQFAVLDRSFVSVLAYTAALAEMHAAADWRALAELEARRRPRLPKAILMIALPLDEAVRRHARFARQIPTALRSATFLAHLISSYERLFEELGVDVQYVDGDQPLESVVQVVTTFLDEFQTAPVRLDGGRGVFG